MMMMMMMMMMMIMNCFCGMVDQQKAFILISSRDHCQISSPLRVSDTPREGFEPAQNRVKALLKYSTPLHHGSIDGSNETCGFTCPCIRWWPSQA